MPIDWFTTLAQAINFLVLVALLKRFLYTPIMRAMDARERQISSRFSQADQEKQQAEAKKKEILRQLADLEEKKQEILTQAKNEGKMLYEQMRQDALGKAEQLHVQAHAQLASKSDEIARTVAHQMSEFFVRWLQTALRDLANADLNRSVVSVFLDRLSAISGEDRELLRVAISEHTVVVRVAQELAQEQYSRLRSVVQQLAGCELRMEFKVDSSLLCGIELTAGGRCIAWSFRDAVDDLGRTLFESISRADDSWSALHELDATYQRAQKEPVSDSGLDEKQEHTHANKHSDN